jgi:hypothetical protein
MQPLANQVPDRVLDLARLPRIHNASGKPLRQPEPLIARLQQNRSPIGTGVRLVKPHHNWLFEQTRTQDRLSCGIFWHAGVFRVTETLVAKPFLSQQGLLLPPFLRPFTHFPG